MAVNHAVFSKARALPLPGRARLAHDLDDGEAPTADNALTAQVERQRQRRGGARGCPLSAGKVRTCTLGPRRLEDETAWIERQRRLWDERFDELERIVGERRRKEQIDGRTKRA